MTIFEKKEFKNAVYRHLLENKMGDEKARELSENCQFAILKHYIPSIENVWAGSIALIVYDAGSEFYEVCRVLTDTQRNKFLQGIKSKISLE